MNVELIIRSIRSACAALRESRSRGSDTADSLFSSGASAYQAADYATREHVRLSLTLDDSSCLWAFSDRFVELALVTREATWLDRAVVAHAIEDFRADPRENHRRLVLVLWAAEDLGVSEQEVLSERMDLFSKSAQARVAAFLATPKWSRDLRAMGLEVVREGTRVIFRERPVGAFTARTRGRPAPKKTD